MNKLFTILFIVSRLAKVQSKSPTTPCYEDNGQLKIGDNCVNCYTGCKTCFGNAYWYQCSSCYSGYELLNNLCLPKIHLQSTSFEFNSQINLGMEQKGIFQVGSNNANKYPNYDANDPYPTYQRGYYYTKSSYMTSDKFNLSPWFSISFWVKPYSAGNIFLKRDSNNILLSLTISSSNMLAFNIKLAYGKTLSLQQSTETGMLNAWNQIAISCNLLVGQWYTKIQLIHNGVILAQSQASSQDWYNDPSTAIIGNDPIGSQTFTGFMWIFKYYDSPSYGLTDYNPAVNCTSGCSFCSEDFTCPDSCDFGKFNDNGVCVDCLSECTYGCRTAERCNICETKECYSCSDSFVCDTCVTRGNLTNKVCECNLNSFFNETTKICDICDNGYCSQCLTVDYFDCKICGSNYKLIDTVCLAYTPSGWDESKAKPYIVIDIPFWTGTFQGEFGIFKTGADENYYYPFNTPEKSMDPVPIENRGLYFSNGIFLNSSQIYLPHSFTMIICLNPKNGDFLEKGSLSINSNGKANIILQNPLNSLMHIVTHSNLPLENWTYFTLVVSYFNSTTTLSTYSNGHLLFFYSYYAWIYRDSALSSMLLGKSQDSVYDGFIYWYQQLIGQISDIVGYIENEANLNQLPSCDYDYTFDQNFTCISCNSSCTIGCIRESNCNLCYDQLCRNCSGPLEESICFNCSENSHNLYPNECICDDNAFLIKNSSNWYCEHCEYNYCAFCNDNGHFECKGCKSGVLVDTVCLDEYPFGYFECSGKNCLLTHINPNEYFRGRYGIFIGGYTKGLFRPFNNSEKEDPTPVDRRGFYLDGITQFFQTENFTYLDHIFSIGGWFHVLGTGDILEHYNRLLLTSNGSLSITLQDRDQREFVFATPGMIFSGWSYLAYTVFYANSTTSLRAFLNNEVIFQRDFPNLLFRDISNSTIFLGKSQNSSFHGFLYNFKMWNFEKEAFIYEFKFEVCGFEKNGTCLPLCMIDEYYQEWEGSEPSCEKCLRSCDEGCIRKDTCNICKDVLCAVCPYFGRTLCSQCIPYAYGVEKCKCIENYCLSLDRLSCIKFPYENSPEKYWIHILPNTTIIVGKWSGDFIINTIHPWMIDVHLIDSDIVTFSSRTCTFSPFYENFTCSFNVFVDPSYDNKNGPITIKAIFQGYVSPITFPVSYDDFSVSIMSHPERLGVVFYSGYNYIQIIPDEEISFNDGLCSDENCTHVVCEELLSQSSISSIGGNIDCTYSGPGIISIYVGHIKDNTNSLIFREKVFYGLGNNETNFKYLTVPWKLQKPPLPIALIAPVAEVCCSCIAIFDGSGSSTRLGSLKYQWIFSEFILYSGDDTERMANITLESCNIAKEHKQFNVTLTVTDNFDQQASASITVNMTSDEVAVSGWKDPKIKAITNEITKLIFQYQRSSKIHLDPNPMVIWSLYKKSPTRVLQGSKIYESSGVEFAYTFTEKGEYIIILDAFFNDNTYKISANASIIANPPAPNLVLNGVNTFVFANSNITVNLTASYKGEVFELDKGYAFINKIECSNGEFVELAPDIFKLRVLNKERIFNCSFTIGLRDYPDYESEVSWLYVVKGNIPRVYIVSMFPYLDPSAPVRLVADVADSLRMTISWREKNGHPFIATTPTDQPSMTIQEFSMLCGIEYEFEITVIDPVSFVPVKASIKRYVNCPPNSGTFEVDPKEGLALNTQFNVLFAGWSDLEEDDPISYQVFMQKDENMIALTPKTTENKFQIVLGERGKVKLVGRIYDSRGTFNEFELQVEVNDSGFVDAKERSEVLLNSGIGNMDSNMLISSINSIAHYAFHNTIDLNDLTKCVENLDGTLNKWMNSSMPRIGLSESSTVIDAVSTLLGKAEVYKEKLLLDIYSTQNKALNHTKILDISTYKTIISNLDNLLDSLQALSARNESAYTEMNLFKIINQTHAEGSLKYLQVINPNESPVKYIGKKFNSTSLSADGKSLVKSIEYNSPIEDSAAKFNVGTFKNSDSTSYLVSIMSVDPFNNISDSLLKYASSSMTSSEEYSFTKGSVNSSDSAVTKEQVYSDKLISSWVQPSLFKNTGTIINPILSTEPVTEVSSEISYKSVDISLNATCIVYDLSIEKCSFKYCRTSLERNGVATCVCDTAGLIGVLAYPDLKHLLVNKVETAMGLGIPTVGTIPVFVIYTVILILCICGLIAADKLDELFGNLWKEEVLKANQIILAEVENYCKDFGILIKKQMEKNKQNMLKDNIFLEKQEKNDENKEIKNFNALDNVMEAWEKEKMYYQDSEEGNGIYYGLRNKLKIKLKVSYSQVLDTLLTVKNVKDYIENCIDKRNLEILRQVIDILWKNCPQFRVEAKALCKTYPFLIEKLGWSKVKRFVCRMWKPIIKKIRGAIIIAAEAKKGVNINELEKILTEKKLNVDKCLMGNLDSYKKINLQEGMSEVKLVNWIKKCKDVILIYLKEAIEKNKNEDNEGIREENQDLTEKLRYFKNQPEAIDPNEIKLEDNQEPTFLETQRDKLDETNIDGNEVSDKPQIPEANHNEIELIEIHQAHQGDTSVVFSTLWWTVLITILREGINSINFEKKKFFGYFIKYNDILGFIGFTDLNVPRKFRLCYLMLTISTEITIAILFYDSYNSQIDREFFIIQWQTFWIALLSFLFGLIPLFIKLFFKYNILSSQFEKNKITHSTNLSISLGYFFTAAIFFVEIYYSFIKLRDCPLTNISAYLSYIANALMMYMLMSGIVVPLIIAFLDYRGCFKCLSACRKACYQGVKRALGITKVQTVPTNLIEHLENRQ